MERHIQLSSVPISGTRFRRRIILSLLAMTVVTNLGCAGFWHELKPHRLRRWNYNDSSGRGDSLFSIDDPLIRARTAAAGSTSAAETAVGHD